MVGQRDYRGRFWQNRSYTVWRGSLERSWRAQIAFATFRACPAGVSLLSMSDIGWSGLRRSMAPAGKVKKEGWDEIVAIRESSNVDFDFAADTVQEP
jgi:hypothetical protein